MILLNPIKVIFWTFRRNERDVVNLYDSLSPLMQIATDGDMLNFGYWDEKTSSPQEAQQKLCKVVGDIAELNSAKTVLDVGSGFASPANYWKSTYNDLTILCLNINLKQIKYSLNRISKKISFVNAASIFLPLADNSVDRVISLESAQHFKPLRQFIKESKRILKKNGILVIAIPVTTNKPLTSIFKLGILSLTWSSEHYTKKEICLELNREGFDVNEIKHIGDQVYSPLTQYYIKNRDRLRPIITKEYPQYLEAILYKSLVKMEQVSKNRTIDYVLIRCTLN